MCGLAEDIILKYFFMLVFDENAIKRLAFLNATFLIVDYFLFDALNWPSQFQLGNGIKDLFGMFGVSVG